MPETSSPLPHRAKEQTGDQPTQTYLRKREAVSVREERLKIVAKGVHLNPMLSEDKKKPIRQVRRDKMHDVKIQVSEQMNDTLIREARKRFNGSKTSIATELVLWGLSFIVEYQDVDYSASPYTVHVKLTQEEYQKVGELALRWRCSVRKAVQRVFIESARKKQLGGLE